MLQSIYHQKILNHSILKLLLLLIWLQKKPVEKKILPTFHCPRFLMWNCNNQEEIIFTETDTNEKIKQKNHRVSKQSFSG